MFIEFTVFIFGLIIGSFLNVCIYRIPEGESVVFPSSHCPKCGKNIAFYDNIPVLSFLILRGKCRNCGERISLRYPFVELLNGILFFLLYREFFLSPSFFLFVLISDILIVLAFIDLDHRILPHPLNFGGLFISLLFSPFNVLISSQSVFGYKLLRSMGFLSVSKYASIYITSLLGCLMGSLLFIVVAVLFYYVKKIEGLGHGDIILIGFIGAVVGPALIFYVISFGGIIGALVGIYLILFKKKDKMYELPFGTFLSGAAIFFILIGMKIVSRYM